MDVHRFNYISRLLSLGKPLDKLLLLYSPMTLITFCGIASTWIRDTSETPINARRLYSLLEQKFSIEEYPELWI